MQKPSRSAQCGALGETRAYNERKYQFRVHASPISVRAAVFVFTTMERIRMAAYWLHFDIRQTWIGAKRRVRGT